MLPSRVHKVLQQLLLLSLVSGRKRIHAWTSSIHKPITTRFSSTSHCKYQGCERPRLLLFSSLQQQQFDNDAEEKFKAFAYNAEIVGTSTNLGSFWQLRGLGNTKYPTETQSNEEVSEVAAVPYGVSPGYLSPPGSPIYVTASSLDSWMEVWERVPSNRKKDCVFFAQGSIPPATMEEATFCVVHFEIQTCDKTKTPYLQTFSGNKTVLYGTHASMVEKLLRSEGIETETVSNFDDLCAMAEQVPTESKNALDSEYETKPNPSKKLDLDNIHLVAWGKERASVEDKPPQTISIVGGGILGSATALFLAQKLPSASIVVLDQEEESVLGTTTPASWAWINANSKSPKSYQILNQLGIHAWKHEKHLSSLPKWMGSLVRFEEIPDFLKEGHPLCDGGYPAEGPLSSSRIRELEPFANWKLNNTSGEESDSHQTGFTYHFPDEACVDPSEAVMTLQQACQKLGVKFLMGHNVTGVLRDDATGRVRAILSTMPKNGKECLTPTDLIISAAGVGAAATCLGGIPLLHRPGQIVYANPKPSSTGMLSKILVDPMRSSHLLQRRDGTLVAGGGALEVGGSSGTVKTSSSESESSSGNNKDALLLEGARQLSPALLESAKVSHTSAAVRPMPSDGLPVVGYVERDLYVIVTHSGITLGPILASLAAGEIAENMECDLLSKYRPSRFVAEA